MVFAYFAGIKIAQQHAASMGIAKRKRGRGLGARKRRARESRVKRQEAKLIERVRRQVRWPT